MSNFSYLLADENIRSAIVLCLSGNLIHVPMGDEITNDNLADALSAIPHFENFTYGPYYNELIRHMLNYIFVHTNEPYDDSIFERANSMVSEIISKFGSEEEMANDWEENCEEMFENVINDVFGGRFSYGDF